mmetsp:Transcript_22065/g.49051  ORF Transcript_22065/g.49051 Transcript_22065/m.49051 type:complete len:263 (+) Transcript_22065:1718-2506(+)
MPPFLDTMSTSLAAILFSYLSLLSAAHFLPSRYTSRVISTCVNPMASRVMGSQVPSPPWQRAPTSTRQGSQVVTPSASVRSIITSMWEGPCLMSSASSTLSAYATMTCAISDSLSIKRMPKYTKLAPFTDLFSYCQIATNLCTPSRDTLSTTYSLPTRYSCTKAQSLCKPTPLRVLWMRPKAVSASSTSAHKKTSSEPADCTGFTTHFLEASWDTKARTSSSLEQDACLTALTPAPLTASPMWYLLRRARDFSVPLLLKPMR